MALSSEKSKQSRRNKDGQERRGQDLIDKLVAVRRVAKVVKGGRRFSFAVLVVVGDGKGRVGMGTGKALEVPDAMRKAVDDAKHNMFRVSMREGRTLHHDMIGRAGAGKVVLRAAPAGTGIIAGGPMRAVFETMGIQDVVAKSMGSQNPANMIRATFDALQRSSSPRKISSKRGMRVGGIVARRESTVQSSKVSAPAESNKE